MGTAIATENGLVSWTVGIPCDTRGKSESFSSLYAREHVSRGRDHWPTGSNLGALVGGLGLDVRDGGLNKDVCEQTVGEAAPVCEVVFSIP